MTFNKDFFKHNKQPPLISASATSRGGLWTRAAATPGHSKDTDGPTRHCPDTHGMAGCFCNHSMDPNTTISWTLVSAEDAPLCALVQTIVALRRIDAGEFVMLDCGVHYSMDKAR